MKNLLCIMVIIFIATGCQSVNEAAGKFGDDLKKGMQAGANPVVRGRVSLQSGQTLTCFEGVQAGYLGPRDMASPGQGTYDPRTGTMTMSTAAIPTLITTRSGVVTANNCDRLAADGLLEAPGASAPAGGAMVGSLPPKTPCRNVPAAMQAQYQRKCVSFDPADHCSALPIDGTWLNGQTDLAAICDSRKTQALMDKEAEYQRGKAKASGKGGDAKKK